MRRLPSTRALSHRGFASIWVVVVMGVLTSILGLLTVQMLTNRRVLDLRQNQAQSLWLARAGIELAADRLLADPANYKGESLELIPESKVRIEVQAVKDEPNTFEVTSEASYPVARAGTATRSESRRFRRIVEKGQVHLEVVSLTK